VSIELDRGLVERAQRGDRDAYEALARAVSRRLYLIAHRIVRDTDRAEDAVQQALVAIWRELPNLRDPDRFESWSYRVVVRACLAETRRTRRLGVTVSPLSEEQPAQGRDAFADIAIRDELDTAFRQLSPEHRAVIVLHHYVGLSLGEIAEIMGIPYGTVGSRLHHATRSMRASIEAGGRLTAPGGQQA